MYRKWNKDDIDYLCDKANLYDDNIASEWSRDADDSDCELRLMELEWHSGMHVGSNPF